MTITHVLYGLLLLFEQPNPHDPLPNGIDAEWEAANLLRKDPKKFEEMVNSTLEGGMVRRLNKTFPVLKKPGKK
jgi:ubiquitin-protein ligase